MRPALPADTALQLDHQLCFALYSASLAMTKTYKPLLDQLGLTYPQYLVMLVLWEQDDRAVKEIGELLHLDSGTLTPLLKRMEAAGLVHRQRDSKDERSVRIRLSDDGRALHERAAEIPLQIFCASGLQPEQLENLRVALNQLRDQLSAA